MVFDPQDLAVAKTVFEAVVGAEPKRALALEPVIRWSADAWRALAATLQKAGFDPRKPAHLAALQSLIDQACDASSG